MQTPAPDEAASHAERIARLADDLEARGLDPAALRLTSNELTALERPAPLLKRLSRRLAGLLSQQWSRASEEWGETQEALRVLARRSSAEEITEEERTAMREQLADLARAVPAGLLALANAALPVPGTSVLTPVLLRSLGLLPSRWREAHVLETLRAEAERLHDAGLDTEAELLEEASAQVEADATRRDAIGADRTLLAIWDDNRNGLWDSTERSAYEAEVDRLASEALRWGGRRRWYLRFEREVFGPTRLNDLLADARRLDQSLLVCLDGRTGWVDLQDLAGRIAA